MGVRKDSFQAPQTHIYGHPFERHVHVSFSQKYSKWASHTNIAGHHLKDMFMFPSVRNSA